MNMHTTVDAFAAAGAQAEAAASSDLVRTIDYLLDDVLGFDRTNKLIALTAGRATSGEKGDLVITISGALGPWSQEVVELFSFAVDAEKLLDDPLYTIGIEREIREYVDEFVATYVERIIEAAEGPERAFVIGSAGALRNLLASEIVRPLSTLLAESVIDLDLPDRDDIADILGDGFSRIGDAYFKDVLPGITKSYAKVGLAEILTITTAGLDPAWGGAIRTLGNGVVGQVLDNLIGNYFADEGGAQVDIFDNVNFSEKLGAVLTDLLVDFRAIDSEFIDDVLGLDGGNWIETQLAGLLNGGIRTFVNEQFVNALDFLGGDFSAFDLGSVFDDFLDIISISDIAGLLTDIFGSIDPTDLADLLIEIDSLPEALAVQLGEWVGSRVLGGIIENFAIEALTSVFGNTLVSAIGGTVFKALGGLLGAGAGAVAGSVVFELLDYITDGWLGDVIGDIYDWIRNDSPQAFYEAKFNPATGRFEDGGQYSKDSEQSLRDAVESLRDTFADKLNQVIAFIGEPVAIADGYDSIYMVWGKKHYSESFAYFVASNEARRMAQSRDPEAVVMDAIGGTLRHLSVSGGDPTIALAFEQWKAALAAQGAGNAAFMSTDAFVDLQNVIGLARFANAYRQDPAEFDALMAGDTPMGVTIMQQYLEAEARGFNAAKTLYGNVLNVEEIGSAAAGDTIHLLGPAWRAMGRGGDDTVYGSTRDDVISGGTGADLLYGNEGADTIDGDEGDDQIYGWLGDDILRGGAGNDMIGGDGGNDVIEGGDGADGLFGVDGDDRLSGGRGADSLSGEAGDDRLAGGAGNDWLNGGEGFDTADFGDLDGSVVVDLTRGTAIATGSDAVDQLISIEALAGSSFDDRLTGDTGANRIDGGAGADRMTGGRGGDTYVVDAAGDRVIEEAGGGTDVVLSSVSFTLHPEIEHLVLTGAASIRGTGNDRANRITGNDGANRIEGCQGDDLLIGGSGDDYLDGGTGADALRGGDGDDVMVVDDAGDSAIGGEGYDAVIASIDYAMGRDVERLTLAGRARIGTGNAFGNVLSGSDGADILAGLAGDDIVQGGAGTDRIDGGIGNDMLLGGVGRDILTGGTGADRFVLRTGDTGPDAGSADRITDFSHTDGDRIALSAIDADTHSATDDRFEFIGTAAFSSRAGQLRYRAYGVDTLIEGDTNGDGIADLTIRVAGVTAFVAADFVL